VYLERSVIDFQCVMVDHRAVAVVCNSFLCPKHSFYFNSGRDVPVYLERSVIDFRCVMVDHTYREKLVVRNGANTAMKVSVPNRPDVADYFEFSPNFGFVQVRVGCSFMGHFICTVCWQVWGGKAYTL